MIEFIHEIFSPALLVYTVLLLIVLVYWLVVILGAVDLDVLDIFDFLDLEIGEAAEGVADSAEQVAAAGESSTGVLQALLGWINLGMVPVTVVLSVFILQMWFLAYVVHHYLGGFLQDHLPVAGAAVLTFACTAVVSYLLTGVVTRPLRRVFAHVTTHSHERLVGRICRVRTSEVTPTFGQAELRVHNSFLTISVRSSDTPPLKKGEEAVITEYSNEQDTYDITRFERP